MGAGTNKWAGWSTQDTRVATLDFVIDAEFTEFEREIELISLALVAQDGREFYAVSTEFDPARANEFVRTNVLPLLEPPDDPVWMTRFEMKRALLAFIGKVVPRFWSWAAAPYDWMVMAQLFDLTERVPNDWRYTAYDISLLAEQAGFRVNPLDQRLPQPPQQDAHHALTDARWASRVLVALLQPDGLRR